MLTASQVAKRLSVGESSVRLWASQGKFKGAQRVESPIGPYWQIPEDSLIGFSKGKPGRPRKSKKIESPRKKPRR